MPPKFSVVKKGSIVNLVRHQIISMIGDGQLRPNEKLPSEKELQTLMNISRTALREAISSMVHEGFLEVRRGQGTFVRTLDSSTAISNNVLTVLLIAENLREIQDVRRILEPEIVARVANTCSLDDLDELEGLLDQSYEVAANSKRSIFELSWEFHHMLAGLAGNSALTTLMNVIYEMVKEAERPIYERHFNPLKDIAEHREIITTLRKKDPDLARASMINHLDIVDRRIEEGLKDSFVTVQNDGKTK